MTDVAAAPRSHQLFIAGEWVDGVTGETFESVNPADRRDVIGRFQAGTAADAAMAVKAAEMAFPAWRATPAPKRGEVIYHFAELMGHHKERLARAMTREMGKVLAEARGDVQEGIDIAYLMAGEGRRMFGDTVPSELPDKWAMSIRQPIGVAGIITPWNFPMAIPCWKMMPALVTGNTVVFKPASDTPHCATLLVELIAEAGFPPGTVNLVTGSGTDVGDAIVDSPDVPVISFTGSSATGKRIAERAGRRLKRVSLELGGKNGVVVLRDADLDLATDGILWSAFGTTGQRCTACSRVIVERTVAPALLERLESRARTLRLGSGLDERVDVGPLINPAAVEKVAGYVDIGRGEGELVLGGEAATDGDLGLGNFFSPTIFSGVRPMDRIGQEEIFGPVLSVIPVDDLEAAITALNQTRYGLSASIFTRDVNTAFRAMRDFEAGIVYVNAGTTGAETHLPFGGWKETGNGHREAGHVALDTYTEWKSIYVDFSGKLQRAQIDNQPEQGGGSGVTEAGERIVVITGATGKLGPTVAATFAAAGDRLALLARDQTEVEAVAASLPGGAARHASIAADLATADGARAAATEVRERLGAPTVLLHLVGGYAGGTSLEDAEELLWRDLFELNFWATFHTLRAFLPDIRAAADGRVVTVSTPLAGAPVANIGPYAASKGAVETLTLILAKELVGTSATANVVLIRTIGDEKPTHTRPEEIAAALVWLASARAGATSGQRIPLVGRS